MTVDKQAGWSCADICLDVVDLLHVLPKMSLQPARPQ